MLPGRCSPSDTVPMSVRTSSCTGKPTAASSRRTMRLRPSCSVTFTSDLPGTVSTNGEIVDVRRSVVQFDAVAQLLAQPARHRADDRRQIGLGHLVGRVHQPVRQLAVVGQQQQPLGVGVEAPDVKQLLVSANSVLDEVADARPAAVVGHRRVHAPRLVDRQVHQRVVDDDPHAVDADHRRVGIHARAQLGDDPAVDLDPAVAGSSSRRRGARQFRPATTPSAVARPRSQPSQSWSTSKAIGASARGERHRASRNAVRRRGIRSGRR